MKTQLIFVPFPKAKCKPTESDESLNSVLGGQAVQAISLSKITKSEGFDIQAFRDYITILSAVQESTFKSKWMNPFKSTEVYETKTVYQEMLFTVWNFLAGIHQQIILLNSNDEQDLKEMKNLLEDHASCVDNFVELTNRDQTPFLSNTLGLLIKLYHQFLISIWQIAIITNANKSQKFVGQMALSSVEQLKEAEKYVRSLDETSRSFFNPVIVSLLTYYTGFMTYNIGASYLNTRDFKNGISCLRYGNRLTSRKDARIDFNPILTTSLQSIKTLVQSTLEAAEAENKQSYHVFVNDADPVLPKSLPIQKITPNQRSVIQSLFAQSMALLEDDPWAENPSTKPPSGGSKGAPPSGLEDFDIPSGNPYSPPPPSNMNSYSPPPPSGNPYSPPPPSNMNPYSPPPPSNMNSYSPPPPSGNPYSPPPSSNMNPYSPPPPSNMNPYSPPPPSNMNSYSPPPSNTTSYGFPPTFGSPNPQDSGMYGNSQASDPFPDWDVVLQLKQNINSRIQQLMSNPAYASQLTPFVENLKKGERVDMTLASMINEFKTGQSKMTKENISSNIEQALKFYTNADTKLAKIERGN